MDIKIINRALLKMGESPISSISEPPYGPEFNLVYEDIKKNLLSAYPWRFAIKRVQLAQLAEESLSIYPNVFQLPNDCLLVRNVSDFHKMPDLRDCKLTTHERYQIEGRKLYTMWNKINLIYVADVTDTKEFSSLFREAFVCKLACELCLKAHQNLNMYQVLEQQYFAAINQAMTHDEIMQDSQELGDNSWIAVREAW